ncbi:MAG: diacylglycerol kinase family protein [Gemmatimonadota bacterium]
MKTLAVINPRSANGRTGRDRHKILEILRGAADPLTAMFTSAPMEATTVTRQALLDGAGQIIAVGGDGTVNEVVNGFFQSGILVNPEARLGLMMHGTGGDVGRTFGIEDGLVASARRIAAGRTRAIDVGRVSFMADDGTPGERYFDNIGSFGMSGAVSRRVNRGGLSRLLGGSFAFAWAGLHGILRHRSRSVRLTIDSAFDEVVTISTVAVCNGQYFGGGMQVAPDAVPDDGWFDIVILGDAPRGEMLKAMRQIYTGDHVHRPYVKVIRGRSVAAAPTEAAGSAPVFLDIDGETPGRLPAKFELLPGVLKLCC